MSSTKAIGPAPGRSLLPGGLAAVRRLTIFYPLVGLIVVCIVMTFASDAFLSAGNITYILRQVSINAIIAVGMTLVILTGGIDLSVGAVMALSGMRVSPTKLMVYGLSGLAASIAAVVLTSRLMSGQPGAGEGFELDAIAAVVLGGTSIAGGRGSLIGNLLGALLLGVLNTGLNMAGVTPYVQTVVKGGIILLAIYIERERRK